MYYDAGNHCSALCLNSCTAIVVMENIFSFGSLFSYLNLIFYLVDAMYNRTSAYIFLWHFYGWNFCNASIDFTHYLVQCLYEDHVYCICMTDIVVVFLPFLIDVWEQ